MQTTVNINKLGYRREQAADFVGVSTTKFDKLVSDGRMPQPFRIDGCTLWDGRDLIEAFDRLQRKEGERAWMT